MAKTKYMKKIKNGKEYYFYRLYDKRLKDPKDLCAKSVKELNEKVKKVKFELDNKIISDTSTFLNFFEHWLFEVHFLNKKSSTKERYEMVYRNYIKVPYFKNIKLKDITLELFQNYYNNLNNQNKSCSIITSINKLIAPAIRYAFATNTIIKDFSKSLVIPYEQKIKTKDIKPFTFKEQLKFLNAIKGEPLEFLFLTALNTGLRQGELFALTWDDLDFEMQTLRINKTVKDVTEVSKDGRGEFKQVVQPPKTKKSNRYIPLPDFLIDKLKLHKINQANHIENIGNLYINNNLIFPNTFGKFLNPGNVRKVLKRILKNNDIQDIRFHDLRHTYATRLFEAGEEAKVIQELLGHSSITVTLDVYTHVLEKLKVKSVSKLDTLFANIEF